MSQVEVDKIIPQSGTTLTVGESGDTITVPSGATFDASNATTTLPSNVVTTDGSQTLTNKTIDSSQLVDASLGLAKLSATGTKDATTFLRGDNTFSTISAGITEADQWRLTTAYTGDADPITSNLERIDNSTRGNGTLGTGMTESSGVFTFPSTGIWLIRFYRVGFKNGDSRSFDAYIQTTVDNSNYDIANIGTSFVQQTGGTNTGVMAVNEVLFDVTNTSTHKCRFRTSDAVSTTTNGSTDVNYTYMTFIRLGDT